MEHFANEAALTRAVNVCVQKLVNEADPDYRDDNITRYRLGYDLTEHKDLVFDLLPTPNKIFLQTLQQMDSEHENYQRPYSYN